MNENGQASSPVINLDDVPLFELRQGEIFEAKLGRIAPLIGSTGLGCMLTIVPPGKRAFPFHHHHATHEMFFILEGKGEYRFGAQTFSVKPGDVLAAPAGSAGEPHQIINTGDRELRYLGLSTNRREQPEIVEYPDSNKFAVISGAPDGSPMTAPFRFIGRHDGAVDYWDGEGQPAKKDS